MIPEISSSLLARQLLSGKCLPAGDLLEAFSGCMSAQCLRGNLLEQLHREDPIVDGDRERSKEK